MFAGNGVEADSEDINDLLRAANGTAADDDVAELDVSFDAFSAWMQSSSPLADAMRAALGGMLDDQLDIDTMGIEERELWAEGGGWLYFAESGKQTVFIMLEESGSSKFAKGIYKLMVITQAPPPHLEFQGQISEDCLSLQMLLIVFSTVMFMAESVDSLADGNLTLFMMAEAGCIFSFTIEYLLRMWSCTARPYTDQRFFSYCLQPMNLVDVVAIAPFYLELMLHAGGSFGVIRVLRLARVFRVSILRPLPPQLDFRELSLRDCCVCVQVFKVGSMSENLSLVGEGLSRSASGLTVLIYLMILFIVISASVCHMVEWNPIEW